MISRPPGQSLSKTDLRSGRIRASQPHKTNSATGCDEQSFLFGSAASQAGHVGIITPNDSPALIHYAKQTAKELRAGGVRVVTDFSAKPLDVKLAGTLNAGVQAMLIINENDVASDHISFRIHGQGNLGAKPRAEVVADILASIKERRA